MDLTAIPFNRLVGLVAGDPDAGELIALPASESTTNHLGTVHAAALLAVAEAGSASALLAVLGGGEGVLPVVRRLESTFRNPARGRVAARLAGDPKAIREQAARLATRGRAFVGVAVEVVDGEGTVVMSATVDWFLSRA